MGYLSYAAQLTGVAILASFYFGYGIAGVNSCMKIITIDLAWCGKGSTHFECPEASAWATQTKIFQGIVACILSVGAAIGSYLAGQFAGRGRRKLLMYTDIVGCVAAIICASPLTGFPRLGFALLFIGRFVQGLVVGFIAVLTPMYISENSPQESRGFFGILHQLSLTFGIFVAVLLGIALSSNDSGITSIELTAFDRVWWRIMQVAACIPLITQLALLKFVYTKETPCQDVATGNNEQAEESLKLIVGEEKAKEVFDELLENHTATSQSEKLSLLSAVKTEYYQKALLIGTALAILQQFTGINMVMSSSNALFATAGITNETAASSGITLLNMLSTVPAVMLIERIGRKSLLLVSWAGQTLALAIAFGVSLSPDEINESGATTIPQWEGGVIVAAFYIYVIFFAIGAGPVVWLYISEIYPMEIRSSAMGFATMMNWIFSAVMIFTQLQISSGSVLYGTLAVLNSLGLLFVAGFVVETKGTSIEKSPLYDQSKKPESGESKTDDSVTKDKSTEEGEAHTEDTDTPRPDDEDV